MNMHATAQVNRFMRTIRTAAEFEPQLHEGAVRKLKQVMLDGALKVWC